MTSHLLALSSVGQQWLCFLFRFITRLKSRYQLGQILIWSLWKKKSTPKLIPVVVRIQSLAVSWEQLWASVSCLPCHIGPSIFKPANLAQVPNPCTCNFWFPQCLIFKTSFKMFMWFGEGHLVKLPVFSVNCDVDYISKSPLLYKVAKS